MVFLLGEYCLYGFICIIGIMEVGHLFGVFLNASLMNSGKISIVLMIGASVLCLLLLIRRKVFSKKVLKWHKPSLAMLFLLILVIYQVKYIWSVPIVQTEGDITLETVHSFLTTDGIYKVSPLTGKLYSGAPLRFEILCLPTIYAWLCAWFGLEADVVVRRVVPTVVLCLSYMAYFMLAEALFDKADKNIEKKWWFLVIVALVFLLCEQSVYMEGYGILHAGHLGTTIRNSILIPAVLYAACERKWFLAVLCVLAEMCIVWTFWGMGLCIVVLLGVLAVRLITYSRFRIKKEGIS